MNDYGEIIIDWGLAWDFIGKMFGMTFWQKELQRCITDSSVKAEILLPQMFMSVLSWLINTEKTSNFQRQ